MLKAVQIEMKTRLQDSASFLKKNVSMKAISWYITSLSNVLTETNIAPETYKSARKSSQ